MTTEQQPKRLIINDRVIFDLLVFVFFLLLAIMSLEYNPRARSIPLGLGLIGSFMIFMQLLSDAFPKLKSKLRFISQSSLLETESKPKESSAAKKPAAGSGRPAVQEETESRSEWWRLFRVILWLAGFILLLAYVNYLIAVGAFTVFATRMEAGESWKRSIILGISVCAGFYLLFDLLLQAQL
ncbi:MAG: tripartite tricarboxylate transporter TctB family protein [Thermodesulfobacteriota bacterium]